MIKLTLKKDITSELRQACEYLQSYIKDLSAYIIHTDYTSVHAWNIERNIYIDEDDLETVCNILENTAITVKTTFLNNDALIDLQLQLDQYAMVNKPIEKSLFDMIEEYKEEFTQSYYNNYYEFLSDKLEELFCQ